MTEPISAPLPDSAASPDAVASAFFAALDAQRWREAAALVHPASLARYHEQTLKIVQRETKQYEPPTVEDYLRSNPEMPREVAEYQVRQAGSYARDNGSSALERVGVASVEELRGLSAEDAFARFLAANDIRSVAQRTMGDAGDSTARELATRAMSRTVRTVLGSVPAPPAVAGQPSRAAYVTYSTAHGSSPLGGVPPERVTVLGARLDGTAWKIEFGETVGHELFASGSFAWSVTQATNDPVDLAEMVRQPAAWPDDESPRLRASMAGAGADPLNEPPTTLILEQLAADGAVAGRVEIPAAAWARLNSVISLWGLLIQSPPEPES